MRIPSGLDDGNLFRRRNQKSLQQSTYRRLFRLVVALVLVIVLMKQAGKPGAYRVLFSEPPKRVLLATPAQEPALKDAGSNDPAASPPPEQDREALRRRADQEQAEFEKVSDSAGWKPADAWAFYRLLEGSPLLTLADHAPRSVGVISLLQQPDVYLQTRVALNARIARVSKHDAKTNDFGITSYWEIWLQPLDGSQLPVAFYTRDTPPDVSRYDGAEFVDQGPAVDVEGVYLKRLAFESATGSELAPAIIGRIVSIERESSVAQGDQVSQSKDQPSMRYLVLVAAVLGIGAAALIWLVTTKSARKTRQARLNGQHVSTQLLSSLATESKPREPI